MAFLPARPFPPHSTAAAVGAKPASAASHPPAPAVVGAGTEAGPCPRRTPTKSPHGEAMNAMLNGPGPQRNGDAGPAPPLVGVRPAGPPPMQTLDDVRALARALAGRL